jgi:hypothetical protein
VLKNLLIGIAISPWATDETFEEVQETWANIRGYNLKVEYDLKSTLTPTINELMDRGWSELGHD